MGRMHAGPTGSVGFPAMPGAWQGVRATPGAWHGARFDRPVAAHHFNHRNHHRKVFFIGGYGGDYYACYPVWNGYAWINPCDYWY